MLLFVFAHVLHLDYLLGQGTRFVVLEIVATAGTIDFLERGLVIFVIDQCWLWVLFESNDVLKQIVVLLADCLFANHLCQVFLFHDILVEGFNIVFLF